jgi:hypothetical protein
MATLNEFLEKALKNKNKDINESQSFANFKKVEKLVDDYPKKVELMKKKLYKDLWKDILNIAKKTNNYEELDSMAQLIDDISREDFNISSYALNYIEDKRDQFE